MRFDQAIDMFLDDWQAAGRINSERTVTRYRSVLEKHAEDVDNRDPRTVGRDDVKRTLRRWPKPNTQSVALSVLATFYRWTMEEGYRTTNPAQQTRRPKRRPTDVYRLTLAEAAAMLAGCTDLLETRAIHIGICAGLRNAELRGLQGRHFRRPGFVWVSADIAKGGRERWVPVIADLGPVWHDINNTVADDEYVLPAQRWRNPGVNTERRELTKRPMSPQGLYYLVGRVGERAGISAHVHPHLLRHCYGDHIAKRTGLLVAQAVLGHANVSTTRDTYVGRITLDDLTAAVENVSFKTTNLLPPGETPPEAREAPTRIELVQSASRLPEAILAALGARMVELRGEFSGVSA